MFGLHFSCVACSSVVGPGSRSVAISAVCDIDALATDLPGQTVGSACRHRDADGERTRGDARATRHRIKRGHICALVRNSDGTPPFANETPQGFTRLELVIVAGPGAPKQGLSENSGRHWRLPRPRTVQRTPRRES